MQDATSSPWLSNGAEGGEEDAWSDRESYLSPHDDDADSLSHSLTSSSLPEPMDVLDGLSFVLMQDLSAEANPIYVSESIKELLGWDDKALYRKSFFDLVHPDEVAAARALHYKHVKDNAAATLSYFRLKHASGEWALCAHSRSVIHDMVIGSIALATNGPKAALKTATASEVFVLTPEASRFAFRRWTTPLSVPTPNPIFTASFVDQTIPIHDLPPPSVRVGLLLNRFSADMRVMHCTNNRIVHSDLVFNRSIYEVVEEPDVEPLKSTIEMIKNWGTSEDPGDGGFCPCAFSFLRNVMVGPNAPNRMDATVSAHSDAVILVVKPQGD